MPKEGIVLTLSKRSLLLAVAALAAVCLSFASASAQREGAKADVKRTGTADAARHSNDAAVVLTKVMSVPDKAIPRELLEGAEAVAVCPGVLKAAFVVGGRKGDCVISRRTLKRQWGAPIFYNMAGGSFGAPIGAAKNHHVLLFLDGGGLEGLVGGKVGFG